MSKQQADTDDAVDVPDTGFEDAEQAEQAEAGADTDADEPTAPLILPEDLPARAEAALMTSDRPMTAARVAEALGIKGAGGAVEEAIGELNEVYQRTGRSFRIEKVAGSFRVVTLADYADVLDGLKRTRENNKLSASQLETLAIVAYKQPVVRADIEAIRGAASGEVLRALMDRHLVKIVGRAEELGRPMLYGTTKQFMEVFGLGTLKDLPEVDQLKPVV
ncbi:SMC-Scp complex subunit ScpB [Phycisphaeraceae bacterium D3-23]